MKIFLSLCTIVLFYFGNTMAQDLQPVKLNAPDKTRGTAVMKALSERKSVREFDTKDLSLQDLSDLLWAANGINREDGKRTAPSARNVQDIDVYVIRKDGAYIYNAENHALNPVAKGDFRKAVGGQQEFVQNVPVCLVLVTKLDKMGEITEYTKMMAAVDGGIVCQNINIFCSAVGLATVPRAWMNKDELSQILKLKDTQVILMNNPVGYPKK